MTEQQSGGTGLEAQLKRLANDIALMVEDLKTAAGKEAEALRPRLRAAEKKLHELKDQSAEAWEDLKPGLRKAWEEARQSLGQAASRFRDRREN